MARVVPKAEELATKLEVAGRHDPAKAKHATDLRAMMGTFGAFMAEVRMDIAESEQYGAETEVKKLTEDQAKLEKKRNLCVTHVAGQAYR